jgi:hypothetical protein
MSSPRQEVRPMTPSRLAEALRLADIDEERLGHR